MASTNALGITGTDGVVPIYSPTDRWTMWARNEIYDGGPGQNRFIPKINDYVIEPETFTTYIVEFLDPVTFIPTLREIRPANTSFTLTQEDVLFGVGPGTQADTYRVYLDTSVDPYLLAVDVRLKVAGSLTNYAKIFKGADISSSGHVISKVYDNNGNFISENVPLEVVSIDGQTNNSIKIVSVCNTTEVLQDGELVTAVFYNNQGNVVSKRQLLIENTSFIRDLNVSQKYVSHISLETAFLSPTNDTIIEFPLNIPINALNMMGVVHYSDGSSLRLPVDGSKFSIFGLGQYVSSIVGQRIDLVLNYALGPNEVSYGNVSADGHYVTENYSLITVNPNNSYAVKLFPYPVWVDSATGYYLKWFLYNLDRNVWFDVSNKVNFDDTTGPYDPKAYGYLQRKDVSINLADVTSIFDNFIHVQTVDIILNHEPDLSITNTPWRVVNEVSTNAVTYGDSLYAKKIDNTTIRIDSGISDLTTWLERVYLNTKPLVDHTVELGPLDPTHIEVEANGQTNEYSINDWNTDLVINTDVPIFSNVYIRFIKRTTTGDLHLSVAAMILK